MLLEARKVSYAQRKFRILNDVDIQVPEQELLVVVGPNGAGKSTLVSLLANEAAAEEEVIFFKQKKLSEWNLHQLAHNKAKFSQQNNPDIPLKVKEIVLMGRYPYFKANPEADDIRIIEEMMGQTDVLHLKDRHYNSLSGGEKQRVHLARVFAQLENNIRQKLIFLDEPLNNLDVKHQYNMMEHIRHFTRNGNTAVVILHDLNLAAQYADKVLLLHQGSVLAHGRPAEVFQEDLITTAYNFPCKICPNPITLNPMIIFGHAKELSPTHLSV